MLQRRATKRTLIFGLMSVKLIDKENPSSIRVSIDRCHLLAGLYNDQLNDYRKAIEYYQQALQVDEKLNDRKLQLDALLNIANSSWQIATSPSDYQKIIELAQRGVKLARETNNRSKEARALAILGDAHQKLPEHTKAIEYYQQSIAAAVLA